MVQPTTDRPVRVGVFDTTAQATRAIDDLLKAGFSKPEISVICSDERREELFADFPHPPLPEDHLRGAIVTGGAIGAGIGGVAAATAATTAGLGIMAMGPIGLALAAGAVAGGLIGAMTTRGVTKEMADYYDQAITHGKILVAVEDDHDNTPRLTTAERVFAQAGAEPMPLTAG
jgi:hypothetical protein